MAPTLAEVSALAESLDPKDQVRLIARLLESLPPKHRAAIVEFGMQSVRVPSEKLRTRSELPRVDPIWPMLWERLFDPAKTSELYSAPRRFDLATLFVVTAAYSILFGAMSALNYYFGPITKVVVGILVTVVAVAQAFYKDIANPRGVSIVTGAVAQTIIIIVIEILSPRMIPEPALFSVIFYGVLGGMVSGYLAGVLVGGVFLVADKLRAKFDNRSKSQLNESSAEDVD
jgi:hypothetical protein